MSPNLTTKTRRNSGISLSLGIALCTAGMGFTELARKGPISTILLLFLVAISWLGLGLFYFLGESNAKAIATVLMQVLVAAAFTWLSITAISLGSFGVDIALTMALAGLSWWAAAGRLRSYWNKRIPADGLPSGDSGDLVS